MLRNKRIRMLCYRSTVNVVSLYSSSPSWVLEFEIGRETMKPVAFINRMSKFLTITAKEVGLISPSCFYFVKPVASIVQSPFSLLHY